MFSADMIFPTVLTPIELQTGWWVEIENISLATAGSLTQDTGM